MTRTRAGSTSTYHPDPTNHCYRCIYAASVTEADRARNEASHPLPARHVPTKIVLAEIVLAEVSRHIGGIGLPLATRGAATVLCDRAVLPRELS